MAVFFGFLVASCQWGNEVMEICWWAYSKSYSCGSHLALSEMGLFPLLELVVVVSLKREHQVSGPQDRVSISVVSKGIWMLSVSL